MANKIYGANETAITWASSGGTAVITCTSLANNAGRVGAQVDRGAGSKATRYLAEVKWKNAATPTLGSTVTLYVAPAQANAALPVGDVGASDAALSALDKRRNLQPVVFGEIDVASTGQQTARGIVDIYDRYISPVLVNEAGSAFSATALDTLITLTPMPDEIQ